ncbi:protein BIG GRAIN 1-like A [Cynara cardunculus var. scolymus]|uniref:protein BIG GRAIN 1-like A n=1 Tax=Cynara cardunculus var. scolymus TaxID=59895 RepID=UPI000D628673|nr:protein BIG GRAIN 1-like A [Cynara cardunculus var. scolymus]
MNLPERNFRYQPQPPPPHRRKTPSFSSSLLDSILRSIDETNDGGLHEENLHHQVHDHDNNDNHDHDLMCFASESKRSSKIRFQQTDLINGEEQMPSLRRAIMIDQWMETHNNNNNSNSNSNRNGYVSRKSPRKFSSDSSSSGTTTFTTSSTSSETETPSTYRSLPNSFTISRKTAEAVFLDDTQKSSSTKHEAKFIKSTKLRAMKIYGDLKKVKQPISPGSRISAFLYSLFASSSSKKAKIEETMQNLRSLKKSRSIKQDTTTTCSSFSRSCMSKKQHNSGIKRSVRFYPEHDTVILDSKSIHERDPRLMPVLPKYDQRQWFTEKTYMNKYKNFLVNVDDDDEDEDDLFELEIVGGVGTGAYGQELPVFETTDLRKIRI